MKRTTESIIFFSSLAVIGVVVVGGIIYFNVQTPSKSASSTVPQAVQSESVETIPTSTITIPAPSTSSAPLASLTLPYSVKTATANESYWPKDWGAISFVNGGIVLTPDINPNGANSFLNGASSWGNYAVSTNVSWLNGGWFDIVARVANNTQNFVYCEFGSNGTEIIERVNGSDTQLAVTSASTTDVQGAIENFGMKVYGSDVACTMNNQEVVGTNIQSNESPTGGIGFVIFGQPSPQIPVEMGNILVSPLSSDSIVAPFSLAPPTPPSTTPPPVVTTSTPQPTAPTPKKLPYSIGIFNNSFGPGDGWLNWWGGSSEANGFLTIDGNASNTGGGVLLQGSSGWTDYTFQATVDWTQGETFGLVARYLDDNNYVVCDYDEKDVGNLKMTIYQHLNGAVTALANGYIVNYESMGNPDANVAIQVEGSQATCGFNGYSISTVIASDHLDQSLSNNGEIGFTTWDPTLNNSTIIVKNVSVSKFFPRLGSNAQANPQ